MRILGVDPGRLGCFAYVDFEAEEFDLFDAEINEAGDLSWPLRYELSGISRDTPVICEKVWGFPGQSAKTTWAQAYLVGQTNLFLRDHFSNVEMVPPITWKTRLGLKAPKGATPTEKKAITIDWVNREFPWITEVHLKKHDGRADAVALAYFKHLEEQQ